MLNHLNLVCGEAKSLEGYFNFIDSILKLCICEVACGMCAKSSLRNFLRSSTFDFIVGLRPFPIQSEKRMA